MMCTLFGIHIWIKPNLYQIILQNVVLYVLFSLSTGFYIRVFLLETIHILVLMHSEQAVHSEQTVHSEQIA